MEYISHSNKRLKNRTYVFDSLLFFNLQPVIVRYIITILLTNFN